MNKEELEKVKKKALENKVPILMDDTLNVIKKILSDIKPKRILEIGTAVGYSSSCFSEYLIDGGYIDTIERDHDRANEARENIKKIGVEDKINLYEGDAVEILPNLDNEYDVVFIDANKGKYQVFLEHAIRMIKKGGVIIADNISYKGYVFSDYNKHKHRTAVRHLREYVKEVKENPRLDTEIIDVGDGLAVSKVINKDIVVHNFKLQPKFFDLIKSGDKKVELRLNDEKRQKIHVGDEIIMSKMPDNIEKIKTQVLELIHAKNFDELLDRINLDELGIKGITKREQELILKEFYTDEAQEKYGVVGIKIKLKNK